MEFTGWYPYEIWNRSTYTQKKYLLSNCHVFGAPTYVLEPKLQNLDVNNPLKTQPRINRMEFIKLSYIHSDTNTLVLNTKNKNIFP